MMNMMGGGGETSRKRRCEDCGNQAKRECANLRCKTCCNSRGFQCPAHLTTTYSLNKPHKHSCSSSGLKEGNFPAEVRFPATFRCVRVRLVGATTDHYAYRTSVSIGGHVFKGIVYDQGPQTHDHHPQVAPERFSSQLQPQNVVVVTTSVSSSIPPSAYPIHHSHGGLILPCTNILPQQNS